MEVCSGLEPPGFWGADKAPEMSGVPCAGVQGLLSQAQGGWGSSWTHTRAQGPTRVRDGPPSLCTKRIWNLHRKLMESLVSRRFPWLCLLCIINVSKRVDEHFPGGVNRRGWLGNEWTAEINCKAACLNSLVRGSEGSANPFISKRFLY